MLSNNIKKYRKAQNMSQEELAIRIHVVRQTVSKWENSLSVPDADQLILLAEVLKVSVNDLLGTVIKDKEDYKSIVEELARANEQIARYAQEERIHKEARKIRGLMLWLTIISIAAMHVIKKEILAIAISSVLLIVILIILYRNILLLSNGNPNTQSIKAVTIFDIALVVVIVLFGVFVKTDIIHLTDNQEELFASALIAVIMVFVGIIAPMLPNNRHTGCKSQITPRSTKKQSHRGSAIINLKFCKAGSNRPNSVYQSNIALHSVRFDKLSE